jgi:hypothetical protein
MDESRSAVDLAEFSERPLLSAADASVCSGDGVQHIAAPTTVDLKSNAAMAMASLLSLATDGINSSFVRAAWTLPPASPPSPPSPPPPPPQAAAKLRHSERLTEQESVPWSCHARASMAPRWTH